MPAETPQEAETGETGEALAGTEQTPPVDGTSQPAPVEAAAESAEPVVEQPATEPVKAAPAEDDEVTRLLAAAEADLKARRLTSPVGNNAWDRYLRVLELEPASPDAIRGMERVIESYGGLFDAALGQEDFDKAAGYLSSIGDLNPDSPVFEEGEQRLEAVRQARADRLAEQERQRSIALVIEAHWAAFEMALQREDLDEAAGMLTQIRALSPEARGLADAAQRLAESPAQEEPESESEPQYDGAKARTYAGEMVAIPGGTFRMGDLNGGGGDRERPVHSVTVPDFKLGKFEVTFTQWDACVADGGCGRYTPDDYGWGRGNRPVIRVSWDDIQLFIDWLNARTGGNFRLPTEAEWEYAARAGSTTIYSWGNSIGSNRANCYDDCGDRWNNTAPVGSFSANAWGLHDLHGNVWEWVQDCYNDSYVGAPTDGSAWTSGDCGRRVIRGGAWGAAPRYLRSASRGGDSRSHRYDGLGFRLAQDK